MQVVNHDEMRNVRLGHANCTRSCPDIPSLGLCPGNIAPLVHLCFIFLLGTGVADIGMITETQYKYPEEFIKFGVVKYL